jgi:hypothetical protein
MRLKLSDLQKVVKETLQEKQYSEAFCNEIKRVFGPAVVVNDNLESLVEAANERLDIMEYTGRGSVNFSRKIALCMSSHESPEVRKFVARVLPENASTTLLFDPVAGVRLAAAKKAKREVLEEAVKKFSKDVALNDLFEEKKKEKVSALDGAVHHENEDMLSDDWYESVARKLIQDYSRTLDTTWQSSAVKQFCSSTRASTRLQIDPSKLMDKMSELLKKHDEARQEYLEIKEGVEFQDANSNDPIEDMMNENLSPQLFIDRCNLIFEIRYAEIPSSIMKFKIEEGLNVKKIPVSCTLPHKGAPRRIDEVALDAYTKRWNEKQKMNGEPFKISWAPHPDSIDKITFKMELK